jgi:cytochrome b
LKDLHREKIWDPVTRLWHWVLALAVVLNWSFGTFMSFDNIEWHFWIGYSILGLMAFRIVYGFVGPKPIRFTSLFPLPAAMFRYIASMFRREPSGSPGHNPLGAIAVVLMILVITAQAVTGLFIESDDFFEYGPLNDTVSSKTVKKLIAWHHFFADIILILVILHIAAVLYYLIWKRENLIKPMINGWKWVRRNKAEEP